MQGGREREPEAKGPRGRPGTRWDGSTKPLAIAAGPERDDGLQVVRISTRSRAVLEGWRRLFGQALLATRMQSITGDRRWQGPGSRGQTGFLCSSGKFPAVPGLAPRGLYGSLAVLSRRPCKRSQQRMAVPCGIKAPSASWGTATWRTNWLGFADQCRARQAGWLSGVAFVPAVPGLAPWGFYGSLACAIEPALPAIAAANTAGCPGR